MRNDISRDWQRLAQKMEVSLSAEKAAFLKRNIERTYRTRIQQKRAVLVAAGGILLCLGGWLITARWAAPEPRRSAAEMQTAPESKHPKGVFSLEALDQTGMLDKADASPKMVSLTPGTRFSVEEDVASSNVRVETGAVRFETVPGQTRALTVMVGALEIRDIGTIFTVEVLQQQQARVAVSEGKVKVTWPGGHAELTQGADGIFPYALQGESIAREDEAISTDENRDRHAENMEDWHGAARSGDSQRAYELITKNPQWVRNGPEDLMLAADVMRLTGHPEKASRFLKRVVRHFSGDERLPAAAFTLGKVYLDELGMPTAAARMFSIAAKNRSPLSEEARAREVDAWHRAQNPENTKQAAQQYLQQFPNGARADSVKALLYEIQ